MDCSCTKFATQSPGFQIEHVKHAVPGRHGKALGKCISSCSSRSILQGDSCSNCHQGTFALHGECVNCQPGFFTSSYNSSSWQSCEAGFFSNLSASKFCTGCGSGFTLLLPTSLFARAVEMGLSLLQIEVPVLLALWEDIQQQTDLNVLNWILWRCFSMSTM
jgi:hypothetical protein